MYKIRITEPASKDVKSIINYISNILKNPIAAENLLNEIEKSIQELKNMPYKYYKARDEYLSGKNIRCFTVKNYYIFYRVNEHNKDISIIRILYARSNWSKLLKEN